MLFLDAEMSRKESVSSMVNDSNGNSTHTDHAKAAPGLTEERLHLLIQNSSDIITVLEADCTISYESPSVERVLGYPPEELVGTDGFALVHSEDVPRARAIFAEVLRSPGITPAVDVRLRHRDGSWRHMELVGNNLLDDPAVRGIVVNSRDITQRHELAISEERVRIAHEMHDSIAQVLAYVNTKAQAAQQLIEDRKVEQALTQIEQLSKAAREAYADVREDILGLRTTLAPKRRLLDVLSSYMDQWIEQSGVPAELTLTHDRSYLRLPLEAELQLVRIIQEALANVRKHASATRAHVLVTRDGDYVEAVVEDDGVGFDPSAPGRGTFPRFGLATMRERAEAARGILSIDSAPGEGARVTVRLPADTTPIPRRGETDARTDR